MILAALALLACLQAEPAKSLLVVLCDDLGVEHVEWSPQGQDANNPVATPTLSGLADAGITYVNLWTTPVCSSTRAALLTGRYGHRTGVGCVIRPEDTYELPATEATIADRLSARGYATFLGGKWHLGNVNPDQACSMGFGAWDGSTDNLNGAEDYWYWERWSDAAGSGATWALEETYAPTVTTDAALAFVGAQTGPWFALVSYNLAHAPWHDPPGYSGLTTDLERYRAMIEYLDGEIGRLLAGVDLDEVTVLILSDNGSPPPMAMLPNTAAHAKQTAYRGGIETTMICAGYAVNRAIAGGKNTAGQVLAGHCRRGGGHEHV